MFVTVASVVAALATTALAHGGVTSYKLAGTTYTGWSPYNDASSQTSIERPYGSFNPILSATDGSISCNDNGSAGPKQLTATVAAGSEVVAYWSQWTHAQGPVMVYMASCGGSCSSANTGSLNWFKISEQGLISGTQQSGNWGTGEIIKTLSYTTKIPASLAPGEYMIRHELLALHQANTPQFYPECAQLKVTGSGSATPPSSMTIKLPGGYSNSDPSININIYSTQGQTATTYKVPGPAVWSG